MVKTSGSSFFIKDDSIDATGEVYRLVTDYEYRSTPLEINPLSEEKKKALEHLMELLEPLDTEASAKVKHDVKRLLGKKSPVTQNLRATTYRVSIPSSYYLDTVEKHKANYLSSSYNTLKNCTQVVTDSEELKDTLINEWTGVKVGILNTPTYKISIPMDSVHREIYTTDMIFGEKMFRNLVNQSYEVFTRKEHIKNAILNKWGGAYAEVVNE